MSIEQLRVIGRAVLPLPASLVYLLLREASHKEQRRQLQKGSIFLPHYILQSAQFHVQGKTKVTERRLLKLFASRRFNVIIDRSPFQKAHRSDQVHVGVFCPKWLAYPVFQPSPS